MKREILFRGKRIDNSEWVHGYFATIQDKENYILAHCAVGLLHIEVDSETVGQYTGLCDKDGKKIFEGDILDVCNGSINGCEWKETPYAVAFKKHKWDICLFCWGADGSSNMDSTHWCAIIGNIHDNPELLTKSK